MEKALFTMGTRSLDDEAELLRAHIADLEAEVRRLSECAAVTEVLVARREKAEAELEQLKAMSQVTAYVALIRQHMDRACTPECLCAACSAHRALVVLAAKAKEHDAAVVDNAALLERLKAMEAALLAKDEAFHRYVDERGVEHDDIPGTDTPCPEDDTCECPRIIALNAAFDDAASVGRDATKEALGACREHVRQTGAEHREALVRARNDGLDEAAEALLAKRDTMPTGTRNGTRRGGLEEAATIVRGLKTIGIPESFPTAAYAKRAVLGLVSLLEPYAAGLEGRNDVVGRVKRLLEERRERDLARMKEHRKALAQAKNAGLEMATNVLRALGFDTNPAGQGVIDRIRALKEPEA